MIGTVDDKRRALLDVLVNNQANGEYTPVTAWIDTAFDGHLVLSRELIESLDLESLVETEAVLADGSKTTLETFVCYLKWFGSRIAIPVIANEGRFPLLGTGLLERRVLHVDYAKKEVHLE